ncbi:uncharacterized protein LOC135683369 isoform X2 [Rhopilema esculentum]|uniref:uncharacterized protein LOC135683369 isoform X2 n=1 Tax=Rhopilema esculentum TaxID=499914 RepID=UPI0031D82359
MRLELVHILLCSLVALLQPLLMQCKRPKGEAWMIKSSLVGDEFNTLEVKRTDSPTARSEITRPGKLQGELKRPTREPGESLSREIAAALPSGPLEAINKNSKNNDIATSKEVKRSSQEGSTKSTSGKNNIFIKIDDQDATDTLPGVKRTLLKPVHASAFPNGGKVRERIAKVVERRTGIRKNVKLRQEIESNPGTFAEENIGRPYGDPDGYKTIGDGIYLMSAEQEAEAMPHLTGFDQPLYENVKSSKPAEKDLVKEKKMPDPSEANLPEILSHLDEEVSKKNTTGAVSNNSTAANGSENAVTDGVSLLKGVNKNVDVETQALANHGRQDDLEEMTPNELNALESFQDKLGFEDKAIGKMILTKNVDKGQQEFVQHTNAMLERDNQNQIDKIVGKFKEEESAFVQKNPYVINKPKLLEEIKNVSYHDEAATKRGFLGTNDNVRIEKMYNSLLKEDELISNGMNDKTKASVRKIISRIKNNPEDVQMNDFLNFLEKEDKVTENAEDDGRSKNGAQAKKSKNRKQKIKSLKNNADLLALEPSLGILADTYSAEGSPQLKDSDIRNIVVEKLKRKKSRRVSKKHSGHSKKPVVTSSRKSSVKNLSLKLARELKMGPATRNKTRTENSQGKKLSSMESDKQRASDKVARKVQLQQVKVFEINRQEDIDKDPKSAKMANKPKKNEDVRKFGVKKVLKRRKNGRKRTERLQNLSMKQGKMANELFVTPLKAKEKTRSKSQIDDKDYYWHGTVKPETRQLPTDPADEIRKFGRLSNLTPVGFEEPPKEGIGQVIGDMNNIANIGTTTKDNEFESNRESAEVKDFGDSVEKLTGDAKHGLNKIDENDVSSTSFFSAPKLQRDAYKEILKQGLDPMAQNVMGDALKSMDSKDLQKVQGFVNKDHSKIMALFDPSSLRPKIEEFDEGNERESDGESSDVGEELESEQQHGRKEKHAKKHKMKIVLHLPEEMEGGEQEIHGKGSELPIGTIKDLTAEYVKAAKKPGLGQRLADDDEDTLEEVLSKPTGKLEEFHPATTESAVDYVPESLQGKESNEWAEREGDRPGKETMNIELNEQGKERNDDVADNLKSNNLLAMIKNNEDMLQSALGRSNNGEKIEEFIKKIKENEDGTIGSNQGDAAQSKSVTSKKKGKQSSNGRKTAKNGNEKQSESYGYSENAAPNIFEDQLNYEHKSKEVSQVMPTETVNQIKEIFNADEHLMPINFLAEDHRALTKPGTGPLSAKNKKMPIKMATKVVTTPLLHKIGKNTPTANLVPHSLHIQGGNIHGGDITGGFISGGEISGGKIQGGQITGGRILGGTFKNGRMENGVLYNGKVDGGLIKGGSIYGGKIESGLVVGGKIKGGEVDGGKVSGGEIDGGVIKSGEIRGGVLKSGSIEGGILKGGIIEGGHLAGGVMLGGKLKGGVVRSGVIKGGVIEGGIVDGGVIEDGVIIKGGVVRGTFPHNSTVVFSDNFEDDVAALSGAKEKDSAKKTEATANNSSRPQAESTEKKEISPSNITEDKPMLMPEPKVVEKMPDGEQSSLRKSTAEPVEKMKTTAAQMYKISVDSSNQEHSVEPLPQTDSSHAGSDQGQKQTEGKVPTDISILGAPESWPIEGETKGKQSDADKEKLAPVTYSNNGNEKQKPAASKPSPYHEEKNNLNTVKAFEGKEPSLKSSGSTNEELEFEDVAKKEGGAEQKSILARFQPSPFQSQRSARFSKDYGTTTRATIGKSPTAALKYHWSLNSVRGGKILGSPGKSMSVIGGIKMHSGIATLNDGLDRGYLDAGDYQGECVSDPDVCKDGLTISLTSKIYKDSAESPTRMYLFDSGAGSDDSRGMALWVNRGKIEGAVSSRKGTWCLEEDLDKFQDRWVDYVMTWHPMKGLYLYANCELFAVSGFGRGCDVCNRRSCHQEDKNTHLMFGRPNKGPHFKLTHFSSGDITIYEQFFDTTGVDTLCGTNNDNLRKPSFTSQRVFSNTPIKSPLDSSAYVMKKERLSKMTPEFKVPSLDRDPKVIGNEFEVWPTPSGLQSLSALFQVNSPVKAIAREKVQVDGGYSEWSAWTSCIGVCGGTSMSTRYCNNPVPKEGGHDCSILGPARRTRSCDETNCLAPESLKALARLQSVSSTLENDISKRKVITKSEPKVNQKKDIDDLKEELDELKER